MSSSSKTVAYDDYDETREDCSGDGDDDYVVSVGDSVGLLLCLLAGGVYICQPCQRYHRNNIMTILHTLLSA